MPARMHSVTEDQPLVEAARLMRDHGVGALPVLSPRGELIGILTAHDLVVEAAADGMDLATTTVGTVAQGLASPSEGIDRLVQAIEGELPGTVSASDLPRRSVS
ncbi:CBS domain-containing protein [Ornithinimicrobium sediminis]|uniref:CBS domain-containing protein n=1 Tax=Ornithinimicrobium sediminis TaxID=2904603 RepID=UPI001E477210|nr:CBS domain-containing protein [Ornithinimicrobium sediminis]MCE0488217.1 CBS domain-containing protein [Ornithinimicrobium sediminis]